MHLSNYHREVSCESTTSITDNCFILLEGNNKHLLVLRSFAIICFCKATLCTSLHRAARVTVTYHSWRHIMKDAGSGSDHRIIPYGYPWSHKNIRSDPNPGSY